MGRQKKKKIQLLDLDVLGMILRGLKNIIKCIIMVCANMLFPKHFVWAILEMMMSGNHRVVFASSPQEALPPPPLHTGSSRPPGTGQAPPQQSQSGCTVKLASPLTSLPVWRGHPSFSEAEPIPAHLGFIFMVWYRRCK